MQLLVDFDGTHAGEYNYFDNWVAWTLYLKGTAAYTEGVPGN
jgi:hypothetical protein